MTPRKGKAKKVKSKSAQTGAEKKAEREKKPESEDLEAERDEFRDRLQRTAADFSNYQKRAQRELDETRKFAASGLALDMIGVVDNFQRALEAAVGKMEEDFIKGFQMIEEQLLGMLEKHGIKPIEALGQPFDPNFHDALLEVEDPSLPDKTVKDELERGYMIHDRLLRPTKVRVSRIPVSKAEAKAEDESRNDAADGTDAGEEKIEENTVKDKEDR
ncbi:MAG: nucleotide exchange factor GrpE [Planctomycetota bacterium]